MKALTKSFNLEITLGHLPGTEGILPRVRHRVTERLTAALTARSNATSLEALGRWAHQQVKTTAAQLRFPQGVILRGTVVTYYSEEDRRGKAVMRVDCRTGKIEIF